MSRATDPSAATVEALIRHAALTLLSLAAPAAAGAASAVDAVGWRRDGMGVYAEAQPPTTWSATAARWKTVLPGNSNASPIVVGERIFVCSEPATLLCISARDGAILWSRDSTYADTVPADQRQHVLAGMAAAEQLPRTLKSQETARETAAERLAKTPEDREAQTTLAAIDREIAATNAASKQVEALALPKTCVDTGYATPTPTSDGTSVYAGFGTGVVAAFDLDGNRRWTRRLATHPTAYLEPREYGVCESPVLSGGKLLVHFLTLSALDAASGATLWETEAPVHFGTPVRISVAGRAAVVTAAGRVIRVADGAVLAAKVWPSAFLPLQTGGSPIIIDDRVILVGKGGGAVRLMPAAEDGLAAEALWTDKSIRNWCVASPVHADGLLYALTDDGRFWCIDAATGVMVYVEAVFPAKGCYSSVVLAGPNLYVSNLKGETVVLAPGREFKELARNRLEPFASNLVFAGKRLYVRSQRHLFCIGDGP